MKKTLFAAAALSLVLALAAGGDAFAAGMKIERSAGSASGGGSGTGTIGAVGATAPVGPISGSAATSLCAAHPEICNNATPSGPATQPGIATGTTVMHANPGLLEGVAQPTDGPGFGNTTPTSATAVNSNMATQ